MSLNNKKIGIALGGGSARGLSHIGVLKALNGLGIKPDIVCGTSMGALVGAAYVSNHLDTLESWVCSFSNIDIIRYLDINFTAGGGFADANNLLDYCRSHFGDPRIERLDKTYVAMATVLETGREVQLKEGSLWNAVRASITMPGLLTPVKSGNNWLVDGAIVNPVPVSVCRELGADIVIAIVPLLNSGNNQGKPHSKKVGDTELSLLKKFVSGIKGRHSALYNFNQDIPGVFDVIGRSLNIMQDNITRNRLLSDPPDIVLTPDIAHIGLLEFDRAKDAIAAGHHCVNNNQAALQEMITD